MLNNIKSQLGEHNLSSDDEDIAGLPKDPPVYLASKHPNNPGSNDDQHFSTLYDPQFQGIFV